MATCDPRTRPNASPRARSPRPRVAAAALVLLGSLGAASRAQAQQVPVETQVIARGLFEEGRRLMKAGQYDAACTKLEGAKRLFPGSGVMLNLGDCYEKLHRTASAWAQFGEAASTAATLGRADDEAEAKRRQAALEPKLSRLLVRVAQGTPGLALTRNDVVVDPAAFGTGIPVDLGTYTLRATAPGMTDWSSVVTVAQPGQTVAVDVPPLAAKPLAGGANVAPPVANPGSPVAPSPADASAPRGFWSGPRVASVVVAGAGVVALGVGGGLGLAAKSKFDAANGESGASRQADANSAVSAGNVATVVFVAGGVLAATGVVLWFTAPSSPVRVGFNGRTALLGGSF